jgi:hypothetical protein
VRPPSIRGIVPAVIIVAGFSGGQPFHSRQATQLAELGWLCCCITRPRVTLPRKAQRRSSGGPSLDRLGLQAGVWRPEAANATSSGFGTSNASAISQNGQRLAAGYRHPHPFHVARGRSRSTRPSVSRTISLAGWSRSAGAPHAHRAA